MLTIAGCRRAGSMKNCQNTHTSCFFTGIDNTVTAFDDFSYVGVVDFWYNSSAVRVIPN